MYLDNLANKEYVYNSRRRHWLWVVFISFILCIATGIWFVRARSPGMVNPIHQGPFELSVWIPPAGCLTSLQPLSGKAGYLTLYEDTGPALTQRLHTFAEEPDGSFTEGTVFDWPTTEPWTIRTMWPDGRALQWRKPPQPGLPRADYQYAYFQLGAAGPHQDDFRYPSANSRGLCVLRSQGLYYLQRHDNPVLSVSPKPAVAYGLFRVTPGHEPVQLADFPQAFSSGYAWEGSELTLALMMGDGSIQCLSGNPPGFQPRAELALLGKTAVAAPVNQSTFYLGRDFGVFSQSNKILCIDRSGAEGRLIKQAELLDASLKSMVRMLRDKHRGPTPDQLSGVNMTTLVSTDTVVIGDRNYQRINVIRYRPK